MQPTKKELNDSIDELRSYKDRLRSEIINISQKLRMSKVKIETTLRDNSELNEIEDVINQLTIQKNSNRSSK